MSKSLQCSECKQIFLTKYSVLNHDCKIKYSTTYTCKNNENAIMCNYKTKIFANYKKHINSDMFNYVKYECYCGYTTQFYTVYKEHKHNFKEYSIICKSGRLFTFQHCKSTLSHGIYFIS